MADAGSAGVAESSAAAEQKAKEAEAAAAAAATVAAQIEADKNVEALVSFFTRLPGKYGIPDDSIVVPAKLARYGLSEVVNRMLSLSKPVPFDFLIEGQFLRTDLLSYLKARRLSTEKVLKVEYVFALSEPEEKQIDQVPDWISGLATMGTLPSMWMAASCYDGACRIYNEGRARLCVRFADTPLSGIVALPIAEDKGGGCKLALAGKDGSVRCCQVRMNGKPTIGPVTTLRSDKQKLPVQAVAMSENGEFIANSGWNGEILLWNASQHIFAPPPENEEVIGSKRVPSSGCAPKLAPKLVMKGHGQVISHLTFGNKARFPFTMISASWDSTVRVWDTAAASCVCNWAVARAVTSFSMKPDDPPQLATSHDDGHVSLWDIRAAAHARIQGALALDATSSLPLFSGQMPHRRLASQVVWNPLDSNKLASVGHDGNICILDPRSPKMPLQRARIGKAGPIPTKLLCVTWLDRDQVGVGGSDGRVVCVSLNPNKPAAGDSDAEEA